MGIVFGDSFRGRSVFVTGHTGFKGSWLCLWLNRLGARITGYALAPPTEPNHFSTGGIRDLLDRHYESDIRDESALDRALQETSPDVVLHLAAQSVVRAGFRQPRETFDVNVMGMVSLLECVRRLEKPCAVVAVTSDKCYENREQVWGYRESDPMGEHDPYGASKGAAEIVAKCYQRSFFPPDRLDKHGIKLATARAGNVIGGGDWTPDALVVDIVRALFEGRPVSVRNPGAFRPWQHVLQALSGYLTLASRLLESDDPEFQSGWNFGPLPGNEIPVGEVVDRFLEEWGEGSWEDVGDPTGPPESHILRLAVDKAIWKLGWFPRWNVGQALKQTARWYRRYLDDPREIGRVNLQQIATYEVAPDLNGRSGNMLSTPDPQPVEVGLVS